MQLQNEFVVDTDIEDAWQILTDIERIAPCLPGATLEGRSGDDYLATVKVKVGPIGAQLSGSARFIASDPVDFRATVSATGADPRGAARAAAQIRFQLEPITATRTRVLVETELDISGRIAQFGRGAIADVSSRLLDQFVDNLSTQVLATLPGDATLMDITRPVAGSAQSDGGFANAAPTPKPERSQHTADLDVVSLLAKQFRERYGQAVVGALGGLVLSWWLFGRRGCR